MSKRTLLTGLLVVSLTCLLSVSCLADTVFVIRYNGYYFDPCSQGGDVETCLAINGYQVSSSTDFCSYIDCVEDILNQKGVEHLNGVYEINFNTNNASVKKVEITHSVSIGR